MPEERSIEDTAASAYAADPSLLDPAGPAQHLPGRRSRLGGAVPVRFPPEVVERIKAVAEQESMTVSAWVRAQVEKALEDRSAGGDAPSATVVTLRPTPNARDALSGLARQTAHG